MEAFQSKSAVRENKGVIPQEFAVSSSIEDDQGYKLLVKVFGFLDFRSLNLKCQACQEEQLKQRAFSFSAGFIL